MAELRPEVAEAIGRVTCLSDTFNTYAKMRLGDWECITAELQRLTDENARLLQDEGDALTALQEEHEWQEEHARALKAEAERDALRKRIEDAPRTIAFRDGSVCIEHAGLPDEWHGRRVYLLVEG